MENEEQKYVEMEIELDDAVFLRLAKMAHERDITFNEMVNIVLKEEMERERSTETE